MSVKLFPIDLNFRPYPPHLTSTYTYGMTIVQKVCDNILYNLSFLINNINFGYIYIYI